MQQIPIWWRWYYWLSPIAWTINGLVTSQVGNKEGNLRVAGRGEIPVKAFLKDTFGYEYDFLPYIALAHFGWVFIYFFVFAYSMKFLNFQKR